MCLFTLLVLLRFVCSSACGSMGTSHQTLQRNLDTRNEYYSSSSFKIEREREKEKSYTRLGLVNTGILKKNLFISVTLITCATRLIYVICVVRIN